MSDDSSRGFGNEAKGVSFLLNKYIGLIYEFFMLLLFCVYDIFIIKFYKTISRWRECKPFVPLAEPLPDLEFTVDSISSQKSAAPPAVAAKQATGAPAVAAPRCRRRMISTSPSMTSSSASPNPASWRLTSTMAATRYRRMSSRSSCSSQMRITQTLRDGDSATDGYIEVRGTPLRQFWKISAGLVKYS